MATPIGMTDYRQVPLPDRVSISVVELHDLRRSAAMLKALEQAQVKEWHGYQFACWLSENDPDIVDVRLGWGVRMFKPLADLSGLMQSDPAYAWSWHCNLAMLAVDAGADHTKANEQAAMFMQNCFDVNVQTLCPEQWQALGLR